MGTSTWVLFVPGTRRSDAGRSRAHSPVGGPGRIRTSDTRFRKPLLYPLSYKAGANPQVRRTIVASHTPPAPVLASDPCLASVDTEVLRLVPIP